MSQPNVPERDLSPPHEVCPVCGHPESERESALVQTNPPVGIRICALCRAAFTERFPSNEYLESLYAPDAYTPDLNESPGAVQRLATHVVDGMHALGLTEHTTLRLLDFGGANGTLLREVVARLPDSVDRERSRFVVADLFPQELDPPLEYVRSADLSPTDDRFDVILLSAVIEHLPNAGDELRRLDRHLRDGGLMYGRTPWDMPFVRLVPSYSLRWPRHLLDLGPAFWANAGSAVLPNYVYERGGTSPPDSDFSHAPVRAVATRLLKGVGAAEAATIQRWLSYEQPKWRYQGSWDAWLRKPVRSAEVTS